MKCDSAQTQLQCLLEPKVLLEDPMWELDISNADSILNQIKSESDSADDKDFSDEDSIPVSTCMYNFGFLFHDVYLYSNVKIIHIMRNLCQLLTCFLVLLCGIHNMQCKKGCNACRCASHSVRFVKIQFLHCKSFVFCFPTDIQRTVLSL